MARKHLLQVLPSVPEVAILHAVKALGSAQTNFAGGQGYYNFLTFLAPYMEGMAYTEIKQNMQMFVYEMTQMMVARGGQLRLFVESSLARVFPRSGRRSPASTREKYGMANLHPAGPMGSSNVKSACFSRHSWK